MDIISATLPRSRNSVKHRDHSVQRRAYLDTYAKMRSGASSVSNNTLQKTQNVQSSTSTAMPMFVDPVQGQAVNFVSSVQTQSSQYVNNQEDINYIPSSTVHAHNISVNKKDTDAKTYIDNIIGYTSQNSVTKATEQPLKSVESQVDMQYTVSEAEKIDHSRIEANLRALYLDETSLTQALMQDDQSASLSHMRTIVASAFACGVIAVSLFTFFGRMGSQPVVALPVGSPVIEVEAPIKSSTNGVANNKSEPRHIAINPNYPARLIIGGIGVDAPVEAVGQTAEGLMEVPKSYGNVGWYSKGAYPGQKGPAVLAGHFTGGYGGVFDKLADLKEGDLVTTTNGKGESLTYKVTKKVEYEKDKVPMAELFKTSDESRLEIITCSGKWQANNYNKRLVVTAELVK